MKGQGEAGRGHIQTAQPMRSQTPIFIDFAGRRGHKQTWSSFTVAAVLPPSVRPQAFTSSGMSLRVPKGRGIGGCAIHHQSCKRSRQPTPGARSGRTSLVSRRGRSRSFLITLFAALAFSPAAVHAQSDGLEVPANAQADRYGSGWECDLGFREAGGACVALDIPTNAFPTGRDYGDGWECAYGYERRNRSCEEIVVPANAYLNAMGDGWSCERLFERVADRCDALVVPDNGFLTNRYAGTAIECNWGYRLDRGDCVEIDVPANARLTDSYTDAGWVCLRGFRAAGTACVPLDIPENAYLADDVYSLGWACERGYRALRDSCEEVVLPANAHLNRMGDGWACDRPFTRRQDQCVLE